MKISINNWIDNFNSGKYNSVDIDIQVSAGWYDWFCRDSSLLNKTKSLSSKVKRVAKSDKIDTNNWYVWFKNNCPCAGKLYDDFRFADMKTGNVMYTIIPKHGYSGKSEVWGFENSFKEPLVSGTWKDVVKFFNV